MSEIDPKLIDFELDEHDGYPDDMAAEDDFESLWEAAGEASKKFPKHMWIEPKDWPDWAAENDRNRTWPIDYIDRFTNQSPTHECTCHALRAVAESCRNRQRRIVLGPPEAGEVLPISAKSASVWLSCLSIYSEANPRIRGGASTRQVLGIATKRGFLPDKKQPRNYGFKHDLIGTGGKGNVCQSSGKWVRLSDFPDGWMETARHFRPLEVIFPESWEEIVCLVLHGHAVGVGRSRHSIPYCRWMPKEQLMQYPDSYDLFRYDSVRMIRSAVGGAYSIISMTTPDDWDFPAGK
jgi:hypothetical protein